MNANGVGDGFTASGVGFKISMSCIVSFTDGTEQTYLSLCKATLVKNMDGPIQEAAYMCRPQPLIIQVIME